MSNQQVIQTTVGGVQDIIRHRGLVATDPITVTVTIDPRMELLSRAHDEARPLVSAAGLSDDDIDTLIKEVRREVAAEDA